MKKWPPPCQRVLGLCSKGISLLPHTNRWWSPVKWTAPCLLRMSSSLFVLMSYSTHTHICLMALHNHYLRRPSMHKNPRPRSASPTVTLSLRRQKKPFSRKSRTIMTQVEAGTLKRVGRKPSACEHNYEMCILSWYCRWKGNVEEKISNHVRYGMESTRVVLGQRGKTHFRHQVQVQNSPWLLCRPWLITWYKMPVRRVVYIYMCVPS